MNNQVKQPAFAKCRILIVDDHPAICEALKHRLREEPDMEVCGEARNIEQAIILFQCEQPNFLIVDLHLRNESGLDLIKRIRAQNSSALILVWSMHADEEYAEHSIRAGAQGYLSKEHATDFVMAAIREMQDGRIFLAPSTKDAMLRNAYSPHHQWDWTRICSELSDKERLVFEALGKGLSTEQIATSLDAHRKTIETYLARIKRKLKVRDRSELNELAQNQFQDRSP